ncbi:oxygenase MpaB family protein [Streptomyces sp. NPDC003691]
MNTGRITETDSPPIPPSFTYRLARHSPAGRALEKKLSRHIKGGIELPEEIVDELGRDGARGDALSDAFIDAAFAGGFIRDARRMVDQALEHGIGSVPDAPGELTALFAHIDTEPEWLDWDLVERGARVFRRYGTDAFLYFGITTFDGYRRETIAKPLVLTGAYTGNSAFGRFLETCRFWTDVSEPGALRQRGAGRGTAVTVRVMHSMIRNRITPHEEWDTARLGVPLNQRDQFSIITLSFTLTQHMKAMGYLIDDEDVLAHMHFWRYVGHLMGVEPSYYPRTVEDWWRAVYLVLLSQAPHDGPDSRRLGQGFVKAFGPAPEDTGEARRRKETEYRTALGWTRFFVNQEVFQAIRLPSAGLWRWSPLKRLLPNLVEQSARKYIVGVDELLDRRRRHRRALWLDENTQGRPAEFAPVERLTR